MSTPGDLQPREDGRPKPPRLRLRGLAEGLSSPRLAWMLPAAATLAAIVVFGSGGSEPPPGVAAAVAQRDVDLNPETTGSLNPSASKPRSEQAPAATPRAAPSPSPTPAQPDSGARPAPDFAAVPPTTAATGKVVAAAGDAAASKGAAATQPPASRAPGSLSLSSEAIDEHLARGEQKLRAGELATARLYFDRVVRAGDARGALAMARSYDPAVLSDLPLIGPQGDADMARKWYERATSFQAGIAAGTAR